MHALGIGRGGRVEELGEFSLDGGTGSKRANLLYNSNITPFLAVTLARRIKNSLEHLVSLRLSNTLPILRSSYGT